VLVDGNRLPKWRWPATAIVGGDGCEPAISAASIIAKVTRDRIMAELDAAYPGYGWATNQGYGVAAHADALNRLGATPYHRASFAPVRAVLQRLREETSG
jgi:ribonuclease HII